MTPPRLPLAVLGGGRYFDAALLDEVRGALAQENPAWRQWAARAGDLCGPHGRGHLVSEARARARRAARGLVECPWIAPEPEMRLDELPPVTLSEPSPPAGDCPASLPLADCLAGAAAPGGVDDLVEAIRTHGSVAAAARALGIHRSTSRLWAAMERGLRQSYGGVVARRVMRRVMRRAA